MKIKHSWIVYLELGCYHTFLHQTENGEYWLVLCEEQMPDCGKEWWLSNIIEEHALKLIS